jgi:hypothetical protein
MATPLPFPVNENANVGPEVVPYADNPEFNDTLDYEYGNDEGMFVIAEVPLRPSLILHTMDSEGYRAALLDYRQQQLVDLKALVVSRFPTPIANRFDKVENGCATDSERLSVLKDVWETLIFTMYALVVSEFRCLALPFGEATLSLPPRAEPLKFSQLFSDKLSDRIGIVSGLLQLALDRGLDTVFTTLIPLDVLEKVRGLNQARNGFAHDETKSEEQSRILFTQYYDEVLSVLQQLQGLADVNLLRFSGAGRSALSIRFEEYVGHAMTLHYRTVNFSTAQHGQCAPYLSADNIVVMYRDRLYSTSPFLYFVSRDEGHTTKLCFYKKKQGEGAKQEYIFGVTGESKNERIRAANFDTETTELKQLFASSTT